MSCSMYLKQCGAWCCRFIVVDFKPFKETENDTLFFALRGIKLIENGTKLLIPSRCRWLRNDYRCKVYSYRPKSCQVYECDHLKGRTDMINHEAKEVIQTSTKVFRETEKSKKKSKGG